MSTIAQLIGIAQTRVLSTHELSSAADRLNMSMGDLLNAYAREVAEGYLSGKYTWAIGDAALNNLIACAWGLGLTLPDFTEEVFLAFDDGEYIHRVRTTYPEGEHRTVILLKELLGL